MIEKSDSTGLPLATASILGQSPSQLTKNNPIDERTVRVWQIALQPTPDISRSFWPLLDQSEQQRAQRFHFEKHRNRFVAKRAQLRILLAAYLGIPPKNIQFTTAAKGKPRLKGTEPNCGLVFNVSDSGDHALFAIGQNQTLGIDLEKRREITHMEGMAKRCFAPTELSWWKTQDKERRIKTFFDFWTQKESFVKAVGEGLSLGLNQCVIEPSRPPRLINIPAHCGHPDEWTLTPINIDGNFSAHLSTRNKHIEIILSKPTVFGKSQGT